ncbi:AtpZ/AtpI family protein [Albimonas pacifica]|uniref:ATP synthase protein I n=1 Tax=Albimonas pacifica TaxID=1114924 RepID=A0A1I3N185_9RHOB|nr:AtpZ/AtpI family protein [Albimonas pacifica]SFJ02952.1 ATP synthase protein I [Albimonas pacifica]
MTDHDPKGASLSDIDARLKAIRDRRTAETRPRRETHARWHGAEFAWRMVIDLTAGIAVGLAIGWGLDELFGTGPLFMVVFVLAGFASGVKVMLQSAKELQSKNQARAAQGGQGADEADGARAPQDEGR